MSSEERIEKEKKLFNWKYGKERLKVTDRNYCETNEMTMFDKVIFKIFINKEII